MRFRVPEGGGRATDPTWSEQRLVRLSPKTLKKLETIAKGWGTMPERERAKAIMEITKDLPARYRVVIEDYFKALSNSPGGKPASEK